MKTTELFVEQVLIGIAVVFTGCLLAAPELLGTLYEAKLSEIVLFTAGAYLLGMIYDRIADSLLQDADQHHRLLHALGRYYRGPKAPKEDPFPEDTLRAQLWFSTPAASEYETYLRSRIRLTRSLTTLIPALGVGTVLLTAGASPAVRHWVPVLVVAAYAGVLISKIRRRDAPIALAINENPKGDYRLPRTGDLADDGIRAWYERAIGGYDQSGARSTRYPLAMLVRLDTAARVAVVIALGAAVCAVTAERPIVALAVAVATLLTTALCGWTWWRITQTFFAFLNDHSINAPRSKAP